MEKVKHEREGTHPRVRIVRILSSAIVQISGIAGVVLLEVSAIQNGANGETLPLIVGAIMLLVGVKAREVLDLFGTTKK